MREPALIFDFGNVVAFFDYGRACDRFGKRMGLTGEAVRERILERGFVDLLGQFESGRMAPDEFAAELMARAGMTMSYDDFVRDWQDIFQLNEPVARLIELLKPAGYPLLLGSNTNILHSSHFRRQFATTMNLLDGLVLSYEVGHIKPRAEFYDACARAAGLPATACVFIDDIEENVAGARQAGLTGLHYVDTPTLITDLRRLGVAVPSVEV